MPAVNNMLNTQTFNDMFENNVPIADALAQAMERDEEHARGRDRGALQGIPFSVKDSYMVKGMTMAAGSPAFAHVTANEDSFSVEVLKAAGAVRVEGWVLARAVHDPANPRR